MRVFVLLLAADFVSVVYILLEVCIGILCANYGVEDAKNDLKKALGTDVTREECERQCQSIHGNHDDFCSSVCTSDNSAI